MSQLDGIRQHLRVLHLPTAVQIVEELLATGLREDWSLEAFLAELLEQEMEGRSQRRIERLQKAARLPAGKTLANFNQEHLPLRIRRLLPQLCTGEFVDRAENLLVFGLPGRGKTHFAAAVGHEIKCRKRRDVIKTRRESLAWDKSGRHLITDQTVTGMKAA
jgi:DNA replication protein DnaC